MRGGRFYDAAGGDAYRDALKRDLGALARKLAPRVRSVSAYLSQSQLGLLRAAASVSEKASKRPSADRDIALLAS